MIFIVALYYILVIQVSESDIAFDKELLFEEFKEDSENCCYQRLEGIWKPLDLRSSRYFILLKAKPTVVRGC